MTGSHQSQPNGKVVFSLLQIFRCCAALLVLLVHVTSIVDHDYSVHFARNAFDMGAAGVDFFFVLSGFLICHLHATDIRRPSRLRLYLQKRLIRIFPVYWIVTLAILPVYFLVPSYGQGDETKLPVIFGSLFLVPMTRSPILVAGWTLRHELLFYLIFGLLIGVRGKWMTVAAIAWVLTLIASTIMTIKTPLYLSDPFLQILFWPQNLEFVFGCFAALLVKPHQFQIPRLLCLVLLPLCLVAFALVENYTGRAEMGSGQRVLSFGVVSLLIVVTAVRIDQTGGIGQACQQSALYRLFVFLGEASYSIYLVHSPCISALFKLVHYFQLSSVCGIETASWAVLGITVLVSCGFHLVVEQPTMRFFRRLTVVPTDRAKSPSNINVAN